MHYAIVFHQYHPHMRIAFFILVIVLFSKVGSSQIFECENYYILEVRDTIINSINQAVVFKMYTDSNTVNNGHYSSLAFVDQNLDTLTKHPNYIFELPVINTQYDTIEYVLEFENGFTSFPANFNGVLLIDAPHCELPYNQLLTPTRSFINVDNEPLIFFPNPSSERVILSNKSGINITSIELYDSMGKLLRFESSNFDEIDMTGLESGVYHFKVYSSNNEVISNRIIKY